MLIVGRYVTSLDEEAFRSDLDRRFYYFDLVNQPESGLIFTLTDDGPSIDGEVLTESELYARSTAHLSASPDDANLHLRLHPATTVDELIRLTNVLLYYLETPEGECAMEVLDLDANPCEMNRLYGLRSPALYLLQHRVSV